MEEPHYDMNDYLDYLGEYSFYHDSLSKFYNGQPLSIFDVFHTCRYVVLRSGNRGLDFLKGKNNSVRYTYPSITEHKVQHFIIDEPIVQDTFTINYDDILPYLEPNSLKLNKQLIKQLNN